MGRWYYEAVLGTEQVLTCRVCKYKHHAVEVRRVTHRTPHTSPPPDGLAEGRGQGPSVGSGPLLQPQPGGVQPEDEEGVWR